MQSPPPAARPDVLTTREVAEHLRLKERKVYDLVRERQIPCVRVGGKWLFPRALIDRWLEQKLDAERAADVHRPPPAVIAGSHDPLLEWAVRSSRCGLAMLAGGSLDGLERLQRREAAVAALHVIDPDTGQYNTPLIERHLRGAGVVAITWAARDQGLVVKPGNPLGLTAITDLVTTRARLVARQPEAGSHVLFLHLLAEARIRLAEVTTIRPVALTETDVALAVAEGTADAGFAIRAVARQQGLDFVPLARERFDLVMGRRSYFEPPMQALLAFARGTDFAARAAALGGYDVAETGRVAFNG
ncbi:MAG: helix-turn-helix transcriptional regulator [Alphaproteobacteria bacterium]|nr:helix-turn-helix transcriptional regulator [Alphaproteobacteria bacterium]